MPRGTSDVMKLLSCAGLTEAIRQQQLEQLRLGAVKYINC